MVLSAEEAQRFLDKHQIDGRAIGGFSVSASRPGASTSGPKASHAPVVAAAGFIMVLLHVVGPEAFPLWFLFVAAMGAWELKGSGVGGLADRLVIVTNMGVAVAKTPFGAKRVSSWEVRPEHEVRFELDPLEVRKGEDTVELTIGDQQGWAFGTERDAAFRLYPRQPARWSGMTDRPAPSR